MVFKFRMLSDENDHFVRDYEVPYDMTLLGFHEFITRSLGYEEGMSSFFTADKQWNRLREFTLMDMGDNSEDAPLPMADITLGQLIQLFFNLGFVNIDADDYAGAVFFFGNFQVCLF